MNNIKPVKPAEVIKVDVDADEVRCNGGSGSLGHPEVWYKFDRKKPEASCHYCGRKFIKNPA